MHGRRRRYLYVISAILVASFGLFVLTSWIMARSFVAPHHEAVGSAPTGSPFEIKRVAFTTVDGLKLSGWYFPATGKPGVVMLHGYWGNRRHMVDRALLFRRAGFSVLIYDARGSGESEGEMISFGYHERNDLLAALGYMRSQGVVDIACLGASQGGATILFAADQLRRMGVRCVVLESTYNTLEATIERRFNSFLGLPLHPLGDLLVYFGQEQLGVAIDSINPLRAITSLHVPLLIISGEEDTRVLVEDTRQLYRAANAPKELWLVPKAGHDDLFHYARTEYEKRVVGFTEKYINKSPPQSPP